VIRVATMVRSPRGAAAVTLFWLSQLWFARPAHAEPHAIAGESSGQRALRDARGAAVYSGLVQLRANESPGEEHLVGDSTDAAGMRWTKITNIALDLLATLVAIEHRHVESVAARAHVSAVLAALSGVESFSGIPPEALLISGGLSAERRGVTLRISSIDAAWLTLSLSVVEGYFSGLDPALSQAARALLATQDYSPLVGADGLLLGGLVVDAESRRVLDGFGFSYSDRNSEARPLILALVNMGKLPRSTWDNQHYTWITRDGLPIASGFHLSAFVEMSGALLFDEMSLAPQSLGLSHKNYVEASRREAKRLGHQIWGYAPTGGPDGAYSEYGLNRPDVVSPYAAALLALTGDTDAERNASAILQALPSDGRPLPDGLDPKTSAVSCPLSHTLDQSLLYLALHAGTLQRLARRTSWYVPAERQLSDLDEKLRPPAGLTAPAPRARRDSERSASLEGAVPAPRPPSSEPASAPPGAADPGALGALAAAVLGGQSSAGGSVALAASAAQLVQASAARAWLELLPSFTLSLRHESWHAVDEPWDRAAWWAEGEARLVLSPRQVALGVAAQRAAELARLGVGAAEHATLELALRAEIALYSAERRSLALERERAALAPLRLGMASDPRSDAAAQFVLLDVRLKELDQRLVALESEKQAARAALVDLTRAPLAGSGLDPGWTLDQARASFERAALQRRELDERAAGAQLELADAQAGAAEAQAWYVPELRARSFVAVPHAAAGSGDASWVLDRVTGEIDVAFGWRAGTSDTIRAARAARERSAHELVRVRAALSEARAIATLRSQSRRTAWTERAGDAAADSLYAHRLERFRSGELDVRSVLDASRDRLSEAERDERLFAEALDAELTLAGIESRSPAPPLGSGPTSALAAADAELERAQRLAAAEATGRHRFGVEAGILGPFYQREITAVAPSAGGLVGGPGGLGARAAAELTLVTRLTLDVPWAGGESRAAQAEAELRGAQRTLAYKTRLGEEARARLQLAYARARQDLAREILDLANERRALLAQLRARGLLADPTLEWQADLRAAAAREQWRRAASAADEARVHFEHVLGHGRGMETDTNVQLDALEAWLVTSYYPRQALVGFRSQLMPAIAQLEQRWVEAQRDAAQTPAHTSNLLVQATHGLGATAWTLGLGLGESLDAPVQPFEVLAAAERAGAHADAGRTAREEIERARARARSAHALARASHELASRDRERMSEALRELVQSQATDHEQHVSSRLRARSELLDRLLETELRRVAARGELALATLGLLELGDAEAVERSDVSAPPSSAETAGVAAARARWVDADVAVARAASVTDAIERAGRRAPVLAGFHPIGPVVGVAVVQQPAAQPGAAATRDLLASAGLGVEYAFDEGLGFIEMDRLGAAARLELAVAREGSESAAVALLGDAWHARERRRAWAGQVAETQRRLEDILRPRYRAAQIPLAQLGDAERAHTLAELELRRAEVDERAASTELARRGVSSGDALLDEYAQCTTAPLDAAALETLELQSTSSSPLRAALAQRTRAASADAWLRALAVISGTSLFLEFAPQGHSSDLPGVDGWDRRHAVMTTFILPVRPTALASAAEATRRTALARSEQAAHERQVVAETRALGEGHDAASRAWEASERWRQASESALGEVERRYGAGVDRTTIEHLFAARDERFSAERAEIDARAAVLGSCARLQLRRARNAAVPPPPD
jgi:hypothetical protein